MQRNQFRGKANMVIPGQGNVKTHLNPASGEEKGSQGVSRDIIYV